MVKVSIFLSLVRQLIILVPLLYFLPLVMEEKGVWMSFPISDLASIVISAFFVIRLFAKLSKLGDGEDATVLGSRL